MEFISNNKTRFGKAKLRSDYFNIKQSNIEILKNTFSDLDKVSPSFYIKTFPTLMDDVFEFINDLGIDTPSEFIMDAIYDCNNGNNINSNLYPTLVIDTQGYSFETIKVEDLEDNDLECESDIIVRLGRIMDGNFISYTSVPVGETEIMDLVIDVRVKDSEKHKYDIDHDTSDEYDYVSEVEQAYGVSFCAGVEIRNLEGLMEVSREIFKVCFDNLDWSNIPTSLYIYLAIYIMEQSLCEYIDVSNLRFGTVLNLLNHKEAHVIEKCLESSTSERCILTIGLYKAILENMNDKRMTA